jgi:hypothetical protein
MTTAPIFCCFRPQKIEFIFLDIDLFLISSVSKQHTHEGQTIQWPKEKVQNDKQRSTKHTHKLKIE